MDAKEIWEFLQQYDIKSNNMPTIPTLDQVLAAGATLTEDRTVDINGKDLEFKDGATSLWYLSKVYQEIRVSDDPDKRAQFDLVSDSTIPQHSFEFSASDGIEEVIFRGDGITGAFTLTGVLNLPVHAAPASPNDGDIWRESNTNTGLKVRINGVTKTITVS